MREWAQSRLVQKLFQGNSATIAAYTLTGCRKAGKRNQGRTTGCNRLLDFLRMRHMSRSGRPGCAGFAAATFLILAFVAFSSTPGYAIPAFARKYGLPCSACHIGWPILNSFGQSFRDNGYQIGNDRDSPIYQNNAYWPITFRVTPQWHLENTNHVAVDAVPGNPGAGQVDKSVTVHGFDLSGLDIWTAGTLYKNISFSVLPSMAEGDTFHFENAWVRFDNLFNSPWLNLKLGKFELDTLLSEKRFLTLSSVGGSWYNYHFIPQGDINQFSGIGDNQIGLELMGHNKNSYLRYSIALLSSVGGQPGLTTGQGAIGGTARTYDVYSNVNYGFNVRDLGLQRIGVYGYLGQSPTYYQTSNGTPIQAAGNRSFSRVGAYGWWFFKDLDVETLYMHGQDNVFLGNGLPANDPGGLPAGAAGPTWNGGFIEAHYAYNPQLIFTGRYELVHMSRQANPAFQSTLGNVDSWTIGYRWYPIMFSRAGLAFHNEYSRATMGNLGFNAKDQTGQSVLIGFDFDY